MIPYDQRGFGWSSPPGVPYPPVADLDAVLNYAGVSQAALGGCSLPGAIIIEYALAHPARVTSLVPDAARHPRRHRKTIEPGPEDETTQWDVLRSATYSRPHDRLSTESAI